jgi:N-methylhydantoinase A/oxoprolinase/acetone carboxylase beta subunit
MAWDRLRKQVAAEFAKSGKAEDEVTFRCFTRMQYYGQLNDIEIYSPAQQLHGAADVDALIAAFEEAYGKIYARSAKSPELGYLVTFAIVTGAVQAEKPALPSEPIASADPPAAKATRAVWWGDDWARTPIFEQSDLRAGNVLAGPAIVESPADTLAVPPGRRARLDEHRIFHIETGEV